MAEGLVWQAGDYDNLRNYVSAKLKIHRWKWKKKTNNTKGLSVTKADKLNNMKKQGS